MNLPRYTSAISGILFTALLSLGACKDYLDVEPQSSYATTEAFSNLSNATMAVMGVYDMLSGDPAYGIRLSLYFPYDNDEMTTSGQVDLGRRGIGKYATNSSNQELLNPWNQLYQGIERANICIQQIPGMAAYTNGPEAEKAELQRLYGEALTLRAQFYFDLIRNWGDVPFQSTPSVSGQNFFLPKTDRDVIYDFILKDLATATVLVPWRTQVTVKNERITKGAVKGLRARIALFRGGYSLRREPKQMERRSDFLTYYQIARQECKDIIDAGQHALNPNYEDIFRKNSALTLDNLYGESLFEVAHAGGSAISDSKLGYYNGPSINGVSRYGQGGAGIIVLPTYFYAFDSLDRRRDVTIANYAIGADNQKTLRTLATLNDGKFRRDWRTPLLPGNSNYLGYNWFIMRYSDVLLMFAEADNEINGAPSTEAINALVAVRKRAFNVTDDADPKIGTIPTDKEGFFQALVKERSLEFGGEGLRKYDLIRWNLLDKKIAETRARLTDLMGAKGEYKTMPQSMYYKKGEELTLATSYYQPSPNATPTGTTKINWRQSINAAFITGVAQFFIPNKTELFPLPQTVIDANPALTQDFGN